MTSIGIDLGTSNSLVSYWDIDKRKAVLIKNKYNKTLTPSVVSIDKNETVIVGEKARELLAVNPDSTVQNFKRFMGTKKVWIINGRRYSAIDFSTLILLQLKQDAEQYLNEVITKVVISVPAYFNNDQRQATISAGKMAGFLEISLVSEPTAAAISYGIDKKENSHFLICDLGGGTYDVSLLEYFSGTLNVLAISGDNQLGGLDFTNYLVNDFIDNDNHEIEVTPKKKAKLQQIMNRTKENFDSEKGINVDFEIDGRQYHYERTLQHLNNIWDELYERLRKPILLTLSDSKINIEDLDQIILVGGSTKLKPVVYQFGKLFGRPPYTGVNPDEIVGIGAGIRSGMETDIDLIDEMILTDVSPFSMGVGVVASNSMIDKELVFSPIIERNTPLPASRVQSYHPISPKQKHINFEIYQGERMLVSENLKIGELRIPVKKKSTYFNVRFTYNTNGVLEIEVTDNELEVTQKMLINNSKSHLSDEMMKQQMQELSRLKVHPRDRDENKQIITRLNNMFETAIGDEREYLEQLYYGFLKILDRQNEQEIKQAQFEINEILNQSKL